MSESNDLYLLFKFEQKPPQDLEEGEISSCYKVMKVFSEKGNIDSKLLGKWGQKPLHELQFSTKEQLSQFGLDTVAASHSDGVYLLSLNDFNIGIESSNSLEDFKGIFEKYGSFFQIEEKNRRFFGKFF